MSMPCVHGRAQPVGKLMTRDALHLIAEFTEGRYFTDTPEICNALILLMREQVEAISQPGENTNKFKKYCNAFLQKYNRAPPAQ